MVSSNWRFVCDYDGSCHCGPNAELKYIETECAIIGQPVYEKVAFVFLFIFSMYVICASIFELLVLYKLIPNIWTRSFKQQEPVKEHYRRVKQNISIRQPAQPFQMLISYAMMLPFIIEQGVSALYLYFGRQSAPARDAKWDGVDFWTHFDGTPIFYFFPGGVKNGKVKLNR